MGKKIDKSQEESLIAKGLKPLAPTDTSNIQVTIEGSNDDDLIKLLEDTVEYLKSTAGHSTANSLQKVETTFQRLSLGDIVSLKHRS